jgi:hypothetical protein
MLLRRQGDWRWGTRLRSFLKGKNFMAVFLIVENKKSPRREGIREGRGAFFDDRGFCNFLESFKEDI